MRYLVVVVLGLALLTTGMFFPWGDKQVVKADCRSIFIQSEVRSSTSCDVTQIDARYWSDHLTIDVRTWKSVDGEATGDADWDREFHEHKASGEKTDGNAGLFWGRPVLWFAMGLGVLAAAGILAARGRDPMWQQAASWTLVGAAGLVALGLMLSIGGMLVHAATWSGVSVQRLSPLPGAVLVTAGGAMAIFGAVRSHQADTWRLQGLSNSPLAPIHAWEAPVDEAPESRRLQLAWDGATWTTIGALALVIVSLWLPFAHKDIVLIECHQDPLRAWVCEDHDLEVAYHLGKAQITEHAPGQSSHRALSYDGTFQDAYGGTALLGLGPYAFIVGAMALAAAGAQHALRQEREWVTPRVAAWTALIVVILTVGVAASGIIQQSWTWAGSPAGHLRPGAGAWAATLASILALLAVWLVRRRDNTA